MADLSQVPIQIAPYNPLAALSPQDPTAALRQVMAALEQSRQFNLVQSKIPPRDLEKEAALSQAEQAKAQTEVQEARNKQAALRDPSAIQALVSQQQGANAINQAVVQGTPFRTAAQIEADKVAANLSKATNAKAAAAANMTAEQQVDYFSKLDWQTKWNAVMGPGVTPPKDPNQMSALIAQATGTLAFQQRMAGMGFSSKNFTPQQVNSALFMGDPTLYKMALDQPKEEAADLDKQQNVKDVTDVLGPNYDAISTAVDNAKRDEQLKLAPQATPETKAALDAKLVMSDRVIKKQLDQMVSQKMQVKAAGLGLTEKAGLFAQAEQLYQETFHKDVLTSDQRKAVADIAQKLYAGGIKAAGPILQRSRDRVLAMPAIQNGWNGLTPGHVLTSAHMDILDKYEGRIPIGPNAEAPPATSSTVGTGGAGPNEAPGYDASGAPGYIDTQTGAFRLKTPSPAPANSGARGGTAPLSISKIPVNPASAAGVSTFPPDVTAAVSQQVAPGPVQRVVDGQTQTWDPDNKIWVPQQTAPEQGRTPWGTEYRVVNGQRQTWDEESQSWQTAR